MLMDTAIKVQNLSVALGGHVQALKDVSLELPVGQITAFIGPSGAGKTTLIRSLVGRLQVPKGAIEIFGHPAGSAALRGMVAYMPQELAVYSDLTVKENLVYFARMAGQSRSWALQTADDMLHVVDMLDKAGVLASELSGGQKQRLSLAIALIGTPKLVVLDEPTVGLDPVLRDRLWQLFREQAGKGTTLIISSHSMDEAERCDNLVLVREGEIIAHTSPEELLHRTNTKSVEQAFLKLVGDAR